MAIAISSTIYLIVAWMVGFIVVRDAPGSPDYFFNEIISPMYDTFTCGLGDVVNITYCDSASFDLLSVSNYNESCVGLENCMNVSCEYGSASGNELQSLCADNGDACTFGLTNYYQVSLDVRCCKVCCLV